MELEALIRQIRACTNCASSLPLGPNPVFRVSPKSRLLIIGQAPGTRVHDTGIPWNDPSGIRLRHWLGMEPDVFYNQDNISIIPMGLCYPGRGKSGDNPPRPECAPLWHEKLVSHLPNLQLKLLIGQYAINNYLKDSRQKTLTETVRNWQQYIHLGVFPLVHPSPRNTLWLHRNPWFEKEVVPELRKIVAKIMADKV